MTKVEYRERELSLSIYGPIAAEIRLSFLFLPSVRPPGVNFSSSSSFHCRIFNRSSSPFRQPSVSAKFKRAPSRSFTLLAKSHPFLPSCFVSNAEYPPFSASPRFFRPAAFFPALLVQVARLGPRLDLTSDMQMSYNEKGYSPVNKE